MSGEVLLTRCVFYSLDGLPAGAFPFSILPVDLCGASGSPPRSSSHLGAHNDVSTYNLRSRTARSEDELWHSPFTHDPLAFGVCCKAILPCWPSPGLHL